MMKELSERLKHDFIKLIAEHMYTLILAIITLLSNAYKNNIAEILDIELMFKINGNTVVMLLTLVTIIVWIVEVKTRKKYKFFPKKVKYKYIYEFNRIRMVYNTNTHVDICRQSIIKVLSPKFDKIVGDYCWHGQEVKNIYLDRDSDKLFNLYEPKKNVIRTGSSIDQNENKPEEILYFPMEGKYKIAVREPININKKITLDLAFDLVEKANQEKQYLGIIVQRPTKKLVLSVEFCKGLEPVRIRAKKSLIFGDRTSEPLNAKYLELSQKGYGENLKTVYTLTIQNPAMFYNYVLEWEFVCYDEGKKINTKMVFEEKAMKQDCKV